MKLNLSIKTNVNMISIGLLNYIRSIIEKEDQYALEVLYFCLRRTFENNNFTFKGIREIRISERFHPESVAINLSKDFNLQQKSIALLLSVRALMLKPNLIKYCSTEELFFKGKCLQSYEWVSFSSILFSLSDDEDFYCLFCMLEDAEYSGEISDSLIEAFLDNTIVPPYKNLDNYYKRMASGKIRNKGIVIVNNAYLGDETLITLEIPELIEYIGNTAIAYCENMQEIVFLREDTKFGVFPIIECPKLERIIVPDGSEAYYKEQLPFYKDMIYGRSADSQEECFEESVEVDVSAAEPDSQVSQLSDEEIGNLSEINRLDGIELKGNFKKIEDVFKNKATTYKYFWFLAILELIKERKSLSLRYSEIIPRMIILAWIILNKKICFSPRDGLPGIVSKLETELGVDSSIDFKTIEFHISKNYNHKRISKIISVLVMNVPYRFLSPWLKYTTNKQVMMDSQSVDCHAPYALYDDCIVLDEAWYDCFTENYDYFYSFTLKSLIDYLKSYNSQLQPLGMMINEAD